MKNINCRHCDKYGKCHKKPKQFFMLQTCLELVGEDTCGIADRYQRPPPPPPPPSRIIKEGSLGFCPECGSSLHQRFFLTVDGCIQPLCLNFWARPPLPIPPAPERPK